MDLELADITQKILLLDSGEDQVDLKVEWIMQDVKNSPKINKAEAPRIRLSKIGVSSFNRNTLNWTSSWERFEVAVHSQDGLLDVEKLA